MINTIVVYRGDTVNYYAQNCWESLKPFCLYGAKAETSKGMVQGEIKALTFNVLNTATMGNQQGNFK